jgi:hypothetical protein
MFKRVETKLEDIAKKKEGTNQGEETTKLRHDAAQQSTN